MFCPLGTHGLQPFGIQVWENSTFCYAPDCTFLTGSSWHLSNCHKETRITQGFPKARYWVESGSHLPGMKEPRKAEVSLIHCDPVTGQGRAAARL